ncbi:holothin acyltransferase-like isoform X2 [Montipora capricornis]|uniref:holothin acyltransferase-like isoform X2 n=1 Tax=Montipora capricornis TaxID=246305 RepID=UPI0035F20590
MAFITSRTLAARFSISPFALACYFRHGRYQPQILNRLPAESTKLYASWSATEQFKIRLVKTEEEFESVITNFKVKEGWRPGLKDAECFLACAPSGAFVGELNGKPICCGTAVKYGDSFIFGGSYIVSNEYRGKGYGRMFLDGLSRMISSRRIAISAQLHYEEMYKRKGFRSQFYGARFDFHLPTAMTRFSEISEKCPLEIKCIEEVNLEALSVYDTTVFGFERQAFLSKWLRVPGSHARVAIDSEGSVVGYTVAQPMFVKEEGYQIGPLFADSEAIAERLLKAVFEELLQEQPAPPVFIDAPTKKATEMGERLQGKRWFEHVYMVMNDIPDARFDKWFGITILG